MMDHGKKYRYAHNERNRIAFRKNIFLTAGMIGSIIIQLIDV